MVAPNVKETEGNSYMEVEYADVSDGYRLFIKNAEFPFKGKPASPQVMADINILKSCAVEGLKLFFSLPLLLVCPSAFLTKVLISLNILAKRLVAPHLLETIHMSPFSREFELFTHIFLIELGIKDPKPVSLNKTLPFLTARYISNVLEYDSAYRWRLQDLFSESSPHKIFTWSELKRLEQITLDRNDNINDKYKSIGRVGKQSALFLKLIRYSLLIPKVRKALRKTIRMINYERLCFDEGDKYWASFQLDYDFFGQKYDERMQDLKDRGYKIPITNLV